MTSEPATDFVREIARRFLGTEGLPVERINEGGDFRTWRLGDRAVARFAVDSTSSRRLEREVKVRDALRADIPVAVPSTIALTNWRGQLTVVIDHRLVGASAENQRISQQGETQLSRSLAARRSCRDH
jgi:hypothetical protein